MLIFIILILIILKISQSYIYYNDNDDQYITEVGDLEKYSHRYSKGRLYRLYNNLNDYDKLFVRDLLCHTMLEYKNVKPSFKKMCKSATKQIVGSTVLSTAVLGNSASKAIGQNVLGFFVSNVI